MRAVFGTMTGKGEAVSTGSTTTGTVTGTGTTVGTVSVPLDTTVGDGVTTAGTRTGSEGETDTLSATLNVGEEAIVARSWFVMPRERYRMTLYASSPFLRYTR
jgi:hypothetical protein